MKTYKTIISLLQCIVLTVPFMLSDLGSAEARVLSTTPSTPDFAAIDDYVEGRMRELRIPGLAMGIVEGDRIVHLKGFGIAGSDGRPVTPQTPFQINSLGKPMTGVAIMQLVEAGKLDLDAPVQRYLPWFRVADEAASARITPRHLLSHTSGLPEAAGMEQAFSADGRPDALEQRVRALRSVQLNRPVGASYEYSNAGYMYPGAARAGDQRAAVRSIHARTSVYAARNAADLHRLDRSARSRRRQRPPLLVWCTAGQRPAR